MPAIKNDGVVQHTGYQQVAKYYIKYGHTVVQVVGLQCVARPHPSAETAERHACGSMKPDLTMSECVTKNAPPHEEAEQVKGKLLVYVSE